MKILFTFVGGNGHLQPLIPIANVVKEAGHTVLFTCTVAMQDVVEQAGFSTLIVGNSDSMIAPPERMDLRPIDINREEQELRDIFVIHGATKRVPYILDVCQRWQPDLIVCDEVDFGAMIAGECLGIPYASVVVIASGSFIRPDVVGDALNTLRQQYHLPLDPELSMLSRYLVLVPAPPSFRDPAFPLVATSHFLQPFSTSTEPHNSPINIHYPDLPIIYFTLGTVFNTESGDLFSRVLNGLQDVKANVIVTVGQHIDPMELGIQPDHIHIAQYIPQLLLLPHCDLVISHGGSGTTIASLAHGLPMVLIPMGADQLHNGMRCEALGFGKVLDAIQATSEEIRDAVIAVLNQPTYRQNAQKLKTETDQLPDLSHAVILLEGLGRDKQPIL